MHARFARAPFSGGLNRRPVVQVAASAVAQPASLPVKASDGSDKGTASLALKVAGDDTAKALVHRYMVLVQQNARRVSLTLGLSVPSRLRIVASGGWSSMRGHAQLRCGLWDVYSQSGS